MNRVDYIILAYADSETVVFGEDIIIVLHSGNGPGPCLRAYMVADWRAALNVSDAMTLEYLDDFIFDLRQNLVKDCSEVGSYFDIIREMSVGPLRTAAAGSCTLEDIDATTSSLLAQAVDIVSCPLVKFKLLKSMVLAADRQLQAARTRE